jgi:hypothetical protein
MFGEPRALRRRYDGGARPVRSGARCERTAQSFLGVRRGNASTRAGAQIGRRSAVPAQVGDRGGVSARRFFSLSPWSILRKLG